MNASIEFSDYIFHHYSPESKIYNTNTLGPVHARSLPSAARAAGYNNLLQFAHAEGIIIHECACGCGRYPDFVDNKFSKGQKKYYCKRCACVGAVKSRWAKFKEMLKSMFGTPDQIKSDAHTVALISKRYSGSAKKVWPKLWADNIIKSNLKFRIVRRQHEVVGPIEVLTLDTRPDDIIMWESDRINTMRVTRALGYNQSELTNILDKYGLQFYESVYRFSVGKPVLNSVDIQFLQSYAEEVVRLINAENVLQCY